jgi:hypothetical protein
LPDLSLSIAGPHVYDEPAPRTSTSQEIPDGPAPLPERCSYCGRPLDDGEEAIVLMRDGRPIAAFHQRCHPHHRRSGCSAC